MIDYTELKRLEEAAKLELADIANVVIEDGDLSHHELFQSLASPDVVLGIIKSLEHTTMAAEAEAKEVDERNAVIDRLCTQNQALREALKDLDNAHVSFPSCQAGLVARCVCIKCATERARAALALAEGGV